MAQKSDRIKKPSRMKDEAIKASGITENGMIERNKKWFERVYVKREEKPHELRRGRYLQIGKIYSFTYDPKYKDRLSFWDHMPHLSMPIGHIWSEPEQERNVLAINFGFIPPKERFRLLDRIVGIFQNKVIQPNVELVEKQKFSGHKRMPFHYREVEELLKHAGWKFAIRSYIYKRMWTEPRIISYKDWWRAATFPPRYVRGLNIRAVYYRYKKQNR